MINRLLFYILTVTLVSCTFDPEGIIYNDVDLNVIPPEVTIENLDLESDTILLYEDKIFNYNFNTSKQVITSTEFYLNDELLNTSTGEGRFKIDVEDLEEGESVLRVNIETKTGSGSIAESVSLEKFVLGKEWVIIVRKNNSPLIESTVIDGLLNLSWDKYYPKDFKAYEIVRRYASYYEEITSSEVNSFIDSTYVGERAVFTVYVKKKDDSKVKWCTYYLEDKELPSLKLLGNTDNEYFISWDRCKYYNAVAGFSLYCDGIYKEGYIKEDITANDTICLITFGNYGDNMEYTLTVKPKQKYDNVADVPTVYYYQTKLETILGVPFEHEYYASGGLQPLHNDLFLLRNNGIVSIFSFEENKVIKTFGVFSGDCMHWSNSSIFISENGETIMLQDECGNYHIYTNDDNYTTPITIKIKEYDISDGEGYYISSISNVGTVLLFQPRKGYFIYDYYSDKIIANYNLSAYSASAGISADGKYIKVNSTYFKFENNQLQKMFTSDVEDEYRSWFFCANYIIGTHIDKITIRNLEDFSVVIEYTLEGENIRKLDLENNQLFSIVNGKSIIRNILTGEIKKELDFANYRCNLYKNILYGIIDPRLYYIQ